MNLKTVVELQKKNKEGKPIGPIKKRIVNFCVRRSDIDSISEIVNGRGQRVKNLCSVGIKSIGNVTVKGTYSELSKLIAPVSKNPIGFKRV